MLGRFFMNPVISIVYLAARAHTSVIDELRFAGIRVWEALSVQEVIDLASTHQVDAVVIAAEVQNQNLDPIRSGWITLSPPPFAIGEEIATKLRDVLRKRRGSIQ